jgi:hypothetical protein
VGQRNDEITECALSCAGFGGAMLSAHNGPTVMFDASQKCRNLKIELQYSSGSMFLLLVCDLDDGFSHGD